MAWPGVPRRQWYLDGIKTSKHVPRNATATCGAPAREARGPMAALSPCVGWDNACHPERDGQIMCVKRPPSSRDFVYSNAQSRSLGSRDFHVPVTTSACAICAKGGGGLPSAPSQKAPCAMCTRWCASSETKMLEILRGGARSKISHCCSGRSQSSAKQASSSQDARVAGCRLRQRRPFPDALALCGEWSRIRSEMRFESAVAPSTASDPPS